jgi:hypothetical protein
MANIQQIGEAFVRHYYAVFDSNRAGLQGLYREQSLLSFEGEGIMGAANIAAKLQALPAKVAHSIKSLDVHPSGAETILIAVNGDLKIDEDNPIKFCQFFHLIPTDANKTDFWVHNDIFRLNYG